MKVFVYSKKDNSRIAVIKNVVNVSDFSILGKIYITTKDAIIFDFNLKDVKVTVYAS